MLDFKKLLKECRKQGFVVERTKNNHYKFIPPDTTKRVVFTGSTPSDRRHMDNLLHDLRRSGLVIKDGT